MARTPVAMAVRSAARSCIAERQGGGVGKGGLRLTCVKRGRQRSAGLRPASRPERAAKPAHSRSRWQAQKAGSKSSGFAAIYFFRRERTGGKGTPTDRSTRPAGGGRNRVLTRVERARQRESRSLRPGIARERETSADDAALWQREGRTTFESRTARPIAAPATRAAPFS